jgi:hypothetical protein
MFSFKSRTALPIAFALASLSVLSACGGGSDSSPMPLPIANDPPPPVTPPISPTPPSPPSTPPGDPAPPPVQITLAPTYTQLSATVGFSQDYWPAWNNNGTAVIDGVGCASGVTYHIHALLSIYQDGKRLALPGSIGRNSHCDYEMHTHDGSGVVHIETDKVATFTLGQFMAEWGQPLSASAIAGLPGTPTFYLIDKETITRFTGDPSTIELSAHREILVVTGTSPTQVPRYDWNNSGL